MFFVLVLSCWVFFWVFRSYKSVLSLNIPKNHNIPKQSKHSKVSKHSNMSQQNTLPWVAAPHPTSPRLVQPGTTMIRSGSPPPAQTLVPPHCRFPALHAGAPTTPQQPSVPRQPNFPACSSFKPWHSESLCECNLQRTPCDDAPVRFDGGESLSLGMCNGCM